MRPGLRVFGTRVIGVAVIVAGETVLNSDAGERGEPVTAFATAAPQPAANAKVVEIVSAGRSQWHALRVSVRIYPP
jgi:hypothetical protein